MNLTNRNTFTKWHARTSSDWYTSVYRRQAAERREAEIKRREATWGVVFWLLLAACIIGWPWL